MRLTLSDIIATRSTHATMKKIQPRI